MMRGIPFELNMEFVNTMITQVDGTLNTMLESGVSIKESDRSAMLNFKQEMKDAVDGLNERVSFDGKLNADDPEVTMLVLKLYAAVSKISDIADRIRTASRRGVYTSAIRSSYRRKRSD